MNFVSSMPSSRIGFDNIMFQVFGANVPSEAVLTVAALIAVTLVFKSSLVSSGLR